MTNFLPFEMIAAFRFLLEGRLQTLLTIIGAAVGVSVIVFMSSLLAGVQANIFSRILSTQAHVVISPLDNVARPLRLSNDARAFAIIQKPAQKLESIDQWQQIAARLSKRTDVVAVSPTAVGAAFVVRGDAAKAVTLSGVNPAEFYKIIKMPDKIVRGSSNLDSRGILIGTVLAEDLGTEVGEKLRVRSSSPLTAGAADQIFIVGGIFDFGNKDVNERSAFISLRAAQSLLGIKGGITALSVNLSDPYAAETVSSELRSGLGVNAQSWIETFADLFTALKTQSIANYTIQFFVAVAVALGISSVLVVSVVQRSREIGILRAMGASRAQVLRIFLTQGAVIGLFGSIVGSALGAGFILLWRLLARDADGTEFFHIAMLPSQFVLTAMVATLTGLLTSLLPAMSAARLNPVDAIRG